MMMRSTEKILAPGEVSDVPKVMLATLPPTVGQRRLAIAVVAVLSGVFGIVIPLAPVNLQRVDSFIPALLGVFCVNDLITSALLFSQFSIGRSRALLILSSGYCFAALIAIPQALTFPGAFSPTGLFGASPDSAAWLYFFWHFGFPSALLLYSCLKDETPSKYFKKIAPRYLIGCSVTIVIGTVCALTWLATAQNERLPRLFSGIVNMTPLVFTLGISNALFNVLVLALLWVRRRSLLDQWIMVVIVALIFESLLVTVLETSRFSFGFYAGRLFTFVTSIVVLVVLIAETTKLDARLARLNMMLQREQDNKLMNLAAMAAVMSHEVRQPLMAIAMNGGAALRFLGRTPPNVEEIRSALVTMVGDSHRASQIFDGIGGLFKGGDRGQGRVDLNEITLGVLHAMRGDLKEHGVTARTELAAGLPHVFGHRGQLQEVILNLVNNAIEAMDCVSEGGRVLSVMTAREGPDKVVVTVEDSGVGIDSENSAKLFDAFVTSKKQGMGLGLAICHLIIERHGGQISARSRQEKSGALFQFVLPIEPVAGEQRRSSRT
jgi:signal transduction histidine kinase